MAIVSYGGGVAGRAPPISQGPTQIAGIAAMVLSSTPTLSSTLVPSWTGNLPATISYDSVALANGPLDFAFNPYLNTPNVTLTPLDQASTEANPIVRALPNWLTLPAVQPPVLRAAQGTAGGTSVTGYKFGININVSPPAQGFTTANGQIVDSVGATVQIRGIAHFGFGGGPASGPNTNWPINLWEMGWKEQLQHIKALGFNAVRCPVTPITLYDTGTIQNASGQSFVDPTLNPELIGKTPLQVLDLWMAYADSIGLYILLDMHSILNGNARLTNGLWYRVAPASTTNVWNGQDYPVSFWIRDLVALATRYASNPHFIGLDVFNEPNGAARWDSGDPNMTNSLNYWRPAVEQAATAILAANPNLLIFVQGCGPNFDGIEQAVVSGTFAFPNWGESFQAEIYKPLNIPANKLVLTPHSYGPDVSVKSTFTAPTFPSNLAADWQLNFGSSFPAHPVIPGEWGGRYGTGTGSGGSAYPPGITAATDITWQNAFKDWMRSKGITSSFYWAYTDASADSGGILDVSRNVRLDKLALLQDHWGYSIYTTAFFRTQNPMVEQGMWTDGKAVGVAWGAIQTTPAKAFAALAQAVDSISVMKTSLSTDQFAEGTVSRAAGYSPGVVHQLELLLRFNIAANSASGVCVRWAHNGTGSVVKFNGPVGNTTTVTISASAWGAPADGDVLRAEAIGTSLTIKKNGVTVATGVI